MFKLFNKSSITRKQRKSINNLSNCQADVETWTNYYNTINRLKGGK